MATDTRQVRVTAARLRASDAERDAVVNELAEHLKDGRLQQDEFDERMSRAVSARTRGELDALLGDLPRPAPPRPAPAPRRVPSPLALIVIFVAGMVLLGGITRAAATGGHPIWAVWWLWWVIPVAIMGARGRLRHHTPE